MQSHSDNLKLYYKIKAYVFNMVVHFALWVPHLTLFSPLMSRYNFLQLPRSCFSSSGSVRCWCYWTSSTQSELPDTQITLIEVVLCCLWFIVSHFGNLKIWIVFWSRYIPMDRLTLSHLLQWVLSLLLLCQFLNQTIKKAWLWVTFVTCQQVSHSTMPALL